MVATPSSEPAQCLVDDDLAGVGLERVGSHPRPDNVQAGEAELGDVLGCVPVAHDEVRRATHRRRAGGEELAELLVSTHTRTLLAMSRHLFYVGEGPSGSHSEPAISRDVSAT